MQGEQGDKIRLQHMIDAITEIESYLVNTGFTEFIENSMMRFACIKQLEIIGEASNHLSSNLKSKFTDIEWSQIIAMRNVFVHEYFGIDTNLVWDILKYDLPDLKAKISEISNNVIDTTGS
ncbi:MAG: DUF86 domain-containing protein [Bacteroidia bacterium]|nr:DUF86 domain-containing protein [Bacteroidia bacterium]